MSIRFAINGLGRVGRALVRIARLRPELELVAVNDSASGATLARLLKHDSLHGPFAGEVRAGEDCLWIDGRQLPLFQQHTPEKVPWRQAEPWVVVESTGIFRSRETAAGHLGGPVAKVVISATAPGVDATFCVGVNHATYRPEQHHVVSNASCTTNCLAPLAKVLHERFGIQHGFMATVHCYTNSQRLMDMSHPDPRRARAAALNIIPTTSDAVSAIGEVIPALSGRIGGLAYRVPVPDGSLVDLVVTTERPVSRRAVEEALRQAAAEELAGILAVTEEELVSADFVGNPHSAIVDLALTEVLGDHLLKVVAWYDNEWGYANRLADLLTFMGTRAGHEAGTSGGVKGG